LLSIQREKHLLEVSYVRHWRTPLRSCSAETKVGACRIPASKDRAKTPELKIKVEPCNYAPLTMHFLCIVRVLFIL